MYALLTPSTVHAVAFTVHAVAAFTVHAVAAFTVHGVAFTVHAVTHSARCNAQCTL